MRRGYAFLLVFATLSLVGAGCVSTVSTAKHLPSGVQGTALIGPTCPVERIPADPACADKAYVGTFVITSANGQVVTTVTSAADGTFKVNLDPGDYTISLQKSGTMPSMAPQGFKVLGYAYTVIKLDLDSGIR